MIKDSDSKIAERIKGKILEQDGGRIRRIILYGSRVAGTARPHSDFDLLVIEVDPVSKWEETWRLRGKLTELGYPVDLWAMGEEEFEETKNVIGGFAYPAHRYGMVLYENS
jgi:predicted nucleotidyltransferase